MELDGIPRNSHRFPAIPEFRELIPIPRTDSDSGIARNSYRFPPIPEFPELILELHGISTDSGIAGIGSDSGIANRNHTILLTRICDVVLISYSIWTRSNSVTEFRELRQDGIEWNWTEFLGIPTDSGIPRTGSNCGIARNSYRFRKLTELDQFSSGCRMLCVDRVPEIERNRFRCGTGSWNVQHCGIGCIL